MGSLQDYKRGTIALVKGHGPPQRNRTGFYKFFGNVGFMAETFRCRMATLADGASSGQLAGGVDMRLKLCTTGPHCHRPVSTLQRRRACSIIQNSRSGHSEGAVMHEKSVRHSPRGFQAQHPLSSPDSEPLIQSAARRGVARAGRADANLIAHSDATWPQRARTPARGESCRQQPQACFGSTSYRPRGSRGTN